MNYLAHIVLSGTDKHVQIGNFMGDGVKGNAYLNYPLDFQQGILLHRKIDLFSDTHPIVKEIIAMGRPFLGRYTPVVTDLFFDHFLAIHFREYTSCSLRKFAIRFYVALIRNYHHLSPRFQGFLWHFVLTNRLEKYVAIEGIQQSLEIMVKYRGLQVNPTEAIDFLKIHYREIEERFNVFFPLLQEMCGQELVRFTTHMLNS